MENTNRLWQAPGFRRNTLLMSVELLWEAEKGECLDLHCSVSQICQPLCSVHFTTVRCCETSIWCLLLWLTSLWFSSLLKRILSCQVNLQGLGCSHGPLVGIQTIPRFPLANGSRGQASSTLQNQCFTKGNSNLKNSLMLCPSVSHSFEDIWRWHSETVASFCASPVSAGDCRGVEQPRSQVRDHWKSLAKGLGTADGTAAAADEDWNEEEVPSKGFAFTGGCEA